MRVDRIVDALIEIDSSGRLTSVGPSATAFARSAKRDSSGKTLRSSHSLIDGLIAQGTTCAAIVSVKHVRGEPRRVRPRK
jgi:hypothetical protein